MDGDDTLHINMGLLTFFKVLSRKIPSIKLKSSSLDFNLPDSNLSGVLQELIKSSPISYYIKDKDGDWILDYEFYLNDFLRFGDRKIFIIILLNLHIVKIQIFIENLILMIY